MDDPVADDPLPSLELSNDLVFKLLSSELSYQRGDWQTAFITLLGLAQQTRDPRLARRATEMALNAKQIDEAMAAIRLWRELAPNSEEATQSYLGFIVLGDKLSEALPIFTQRLKEARPANRNQIVKQIQLMLARTKDKAAGFAMLDELLIPYHSYPETHLVLAQAAAAKGDHARAIAEGQAALALKPDSELAALTLAQVTKDQNAATQLLSIFLTTYPKAREVRMAYARLLFEQKKIEPARSEFEHLLKTQPDDLATIYALGVLSAHTDDKKNAELYFTRYLSILETREGDDRDPTQVLLILAQIAEDRGDTDASLQWLAKIDPSEAQNPAYLAAQIKRAQIIAKRGDLAASRKLLADLKPEGKREQSQLILAEAQILRDAIQSSEAMSVLELGLKRFPEDSNLLYDYAMLAEKLDRMDLMESTLRKLISISPDNHHAYNALGYSLAERNIRLEEAFVLIEKALKLAPEDPFIMDSMGWVHFRMGQMKEAEKLLRRAYELRPDTEIAVHLGEVLWADGRKGDAEILWREVKAKDPKNDILKSTLARLNVDL